MSDWERVWEECSTRVARGEATIQDCIARYPEYADELRRLLPALVRLNQGRQVHPNDEWKSRARAELLAEIRSHPRRRAEREMSGSSRQRVIPFAFRAALALAVIVFLLLVSGTMLAQAALPGDTLYGWKIGSEAVFRTVYPDPLTADLLLMHRRAEELTRVAGTPAAEHVAQEGYQQVLSDLPRYNDPSAESKIREQLTQQKQQLQKAGVSVPAIDQTLNKLSTPAAPAAAPVLTATPVPAIVPAPTATATHTASPAPSPTMPKTTPSSSAGGKLTPTATPTPTATSTPTKPSPSGKPSQTHTPTRPTTSTPTGTRTVASTSLPGSSSQGETTGTPTARPTSTESSTLTRPSMPTPTPSHASTLNPHPTSTETSTATPLNTPAPTRANTPTPTPCLSQLPAVPCTTPTSSGECGVDVSTSACETPTRAPTATNMPLPPSATNTPAAAATNTPLPPAPTLALPPQHAPTQPSESENSTDPISGSNAR